MRRITFTTLLLIACAAAATGARRKIPGMDRGNIYIGGNIGVSAPLELGRRPDQVNFKDVVSPGFTASAECLWIQSPYIGLGGEVGYTTNPYRAQYWAGLNQRGTFDAGYKDISAMLSGKILMGQGDIKPFVAAAFGGHMLINDLNFQSNLLGTADDESVAYTSKRFNLGFGIGAGIYYKVGKTTYLSLGARLNIIPYLKEETLSIVVDQYTFEERQIVINPHGNQNSLSFTAGLHFGAKRRSNKRL